MYITAINPTDADHLAEVIEEMRVLGAPVIRAVETCYGLVAIEGSHRLAAAAELGLSPEIIVIDEDDIVDGTTLNDIAGDLYAAGNGVVGNSLVDFTVTGLAIAEFVTGADGATYSL